MAFAANLGIEINGNCVAGTCPAEALGFGATAALPFSNSITLSNGDSYSFTGVLNSSNAASGSSSSLTYAFVITFLGNSNGGVSQTDALNFDAFSAFQSNSPFGNFSQALTGAFSPGIASTSRAQVCAGDVCLGPVSPPGSFNLVGGSYLVTAVEEAFSLDNTFSTTFGAGSPVGAYVLYSYPAIPAPSIFPGGVAPIFSSTNTIQPGEWISIFGLNLAPAPATWSGNFPQSLGGVNVTINSKPAYLWYVSPAQINAQAPDDITNGPVSVTVTTPTGTASSTVTLAPYGPSLSLLNSKYPAAIVPTPGIPGNSGAGYDVIGPAGAFSYPSRPAHAGETVEIYGVGFGPTMPAVMAGQTVPVAAPAVTNPTVSIGGVSATVSFAGIVEAGLWQLNVVVPSGLTGDQLLTVTVPGASTQNNVFLNIQ
jgi:uncharacterized protein (TIGR03437 family)